MLPVSLWFVDIRPLLANVNASAAVPIIENLPSTGSIACTLAKGSELASASRVSWNYDAEGWPSNSVDWALHLLPCYNRTAGLLTRQTASTGRVIAVTRRNRAYTGPVSPSMFLTSFVSLPVADYAGARGSDSGVKQVASLNGTSFWISGIAQSNYGYRYLPSITASRTVLVCGMAGTEHRGTGFVEPGTTSSRGITIYAGQLYGASAESLETTWGGLYGIGAGLPKTASSSSSSVVTRVWGISNTMVNAPRVEYNPFTFVIESPTSIWVAQDLGPGSRAAIVHYTQPAGSTKVLRANKWVPRSSPFVVPGERQPVYSLAGRIERVPDDVDDVADNDNNVVPQFVLYAASPTAVYRIPTGPPSDGGGVVTTILRARSGESYHGVAFPPDFPLV